MRLVILLTLLLACEAVAYEQAFERTAVGEIALRDLPPARLLETELNGSYFTQSDVLFRRLFDYIREHDIAMTVPVEADLKRAAMRFYLSADAPAQPPHTQAVHVEELQQRKVVSMGARGAYSEENVHQTLSRLQTWLDGQNEWRASGEPYAVFWNGPFVPGFLKRFEVHIPVLHRDSLAASADHAPS